MTTTNNNREYAVSLDYEVREADNSINCKTSYKVFDNMQDAANYAIDFIANNPDANIRLTNEHFTGSQISVYGDSPTKHYDLTDADINAVRNVEVNEAEDTVFAAYEAAINCDRAYVLKAQELFTAHADGDTLRSFQLAYAQDRKQYGENISQALRALGDNRSEGYNEKLQSLIDTWDAESDKVLTVNKTICNQRLIEALIQKFDEVAMSEGYVTAEAMDIATEAEIANAQAVNEPATPTVESDAYIFANNVAEFFVGHDFHFDFAEIVNGRLKHHFADYRYGDRFIETYTDATPNKLLYATEIIPLAYCSCNYVLNDFTTLTRNAFGSLASVEAAERDIESKNPVPTVEPTDDDNTFIATDGTHYIVKGDRVDITADGCQLKINGVTVAQYKTAHAAQVAANEIRNFRETYGGAACLPHKDFDPADFDTMFNDNDLDFSGEGKIIIIDDPPADPLTAAQAESVNPERFRATVYYYRPDENGGEPWHGDKYQHFATAADAANFIINFAAEHYDYTITTDSNIRDWDNRKQYWLTGDDLNAINSDTFVKNTRQAAALKDKIVRDAKASDDSNVFDLLPSFDDGADNGDANVEVKNQTAEYTEAELQKAYKDIKADTVDQLNAAAPEGWSVVPDPDNKKFFVKTGGKSVAEIDSLALAKVLPPDKFFARFTPLTDDEPNQRYADQLYQEYLELLDMRDNLSDDPERLKVIDGLIRDLEREMLAARLDLPTSTPTTAC